MGETLYDTDYVAWTQTQAGALRAAAGRTGSNLALDFANLAEEIEDLGKSRRLELGSRIETVVEHLTKLALSPAAEPRPGWRATVRRSRDGITDLLEESPSLRRDLPGLLRRAQDRAVRRIVEELVERGEITSRNAPVFAEEQVFGDWFPPPPEA